MNHPSASPPSSSISPRFLDFWLLGGASIVICLAMNLFGLVQGQAPAFDARFAQIAVTFAFLSLVVNHPHFMACYALAYRRERAFWRAHWFSMLAVPTLLIALFAGAFFGYDSPALGAGAGAFSLIWRFLHLDQILGNASNLGVELLGISIWLMYLTVGWHYAKQTFGCMMLYADYDGYSLSPLERNGIKFSLYAVAFYSFCVINLHWHDFFGPASFSVMGVPLEVLNLPRGTEFLSTLLVVMGALFFLGLIVKNLRAQRKPSINFLVPYIAFHFWWIPISYQKEFYFFMVPFFHSLQYLSFAYRLGFGSRAERIGKERQVLISVSLILLAGFLVFEFVPGWMDAHFSPAFGGFAAFFVVAALVFINVHHFFLDSVLYRRNDPRVKSSLLAAADGRRISSAISSVD